MTKNELVSKLLDYFINENKKFLNYNVPTNYKEKRLFLRCIINLRPPIPLNEEIMKLEDELLQKELKEKKITNCYDIKEIEDKICIFLGDITTIKCDAIVNAANSSMLGCFIPNHSCIDNQIHTYAGIRLRLECNDLIEGEKLQTGKAKITNAYNLPSDYIIHTVGPIVNGKVTLKDEEDLKNCYISCLNIARENNLKTIAFPSISTGVFHFPKDRASKIALKSVKEYLNTFPNTFDKIIFNVFTMEDKYYYDRLLNN